ncbi:MAG TPA: FG-GAP-like repeat-containing protein [Thermoanaerobaculia bacterium]|jgi:hypothetical protein
MAYTVRLTFSLLLVAAVASFAAAEEKRFVKPVALPDAAHVSFVHVADFTGDGRNDLLYCRRYHDVRVFAGNGGAWSQPVESRVQPGPGGAYLEVSGVADFNGDGALDLFATNADAVGVMLGDGQGRFGAPLVTAIFHWRSAIADFDRDGKQDVFVFSKKSGYRHTIAVRFLRGNGDGSFAPPAPAEASFAALEADDAVAGDFDADGWTDIAAASGGNLAVLWNEGGGTFRLRRYPFSATALAAGRMNGDRAFDLLVRTDTPWPPSSETRAFFGVPGTRSLERMPHEFDGAGHRLHDMDGNGTADVLATREGAVSIALSNRDGTFSAPRLYFAGDDVAIIPGDFDSDGKADVGYREVGRFDADDVPAGWLPGNGDGTLRANRAVDLCDVAPCVKDEPRQEAVMDVTGDGAPDFVVYTNGRLTVVPGGGDYGRAVTTAVRPDGAYAFRYFVPAGDVDGDGRDDLVLVRRDEQRQAFTWTVFAGQRDGSFDEGQEIDRQAGDLAAAGDLTGDGSIDLLDRGWNIHPGDGRGRFGPPIPTGFASLRSSVVRLADLDGNGFLDVVAREDWESGSWLNQGGGVFDAPVYSEGGEALEDFLLADFTGDGLPDALELVGIYEDSFPCCGTYLTHYEARVLRGAGDGRFEELESTIWVDELPAGLATLDFDADGDTDLLIDTTVYLADGDGTFRSGTSFDTGLAAVLNGQVVARSGHTYAVLATKEVERPRVVPAMEAVSTAGFGSKEHIRATLTSPGPLEPRGTVRFDFNGASRILPVFDRSALLIWDFPHGVTDVVVIYSGDDNFAPATTSIQQHLPRHPVVMTVEARTLSGASAERILPGTPVRFSVSVGPYQDGPVPSGGTLTLWGEDPAPRLIATWEGTSGEIVVSDPSLFSREVNVFTAIWSGHEAMYGNTARVVIRVVPRETERRRSVR